MRDLIKSIIAYMAGLLLIVSWGATAMFAVSVFFEPTRATPWFLAALVSASDSCRSAGDRHQTRMIP